MSLAGGSDSNFVCNDVESGVSCSSLSASSSGMPNVIDRHCMQQKPDASAQKWLNGFEKTSSNINGSSKGFEGSNSNVGLTAPSVVLYDRKIDFSVRSSRIVGCGFVNLGNTCFLSSTLQCLCHLPPWFNYINSDHHFNHCKMNRNDCMVCMFQRLLRNTLRHRDSSFAPREIVERLKHICSHMQRGRQEDAHEFLLSLLNGMQSSLLHGLQRLDSYSQETTVLCQMFGGYLQSRITCQYCMCTSSTYEHFFNISLDIKNTKSLVGALSAFTKSEVMDGENAYKCDRCKRPTPADKVYSVYRAPNILIIHLKRYSLEEKGHSKLSHHVYFTDTLDLTQFMSLPGPAFSYVYQLQCVLVHIGASINSGHYFAYVCGLNNRWFEMNDERVREVPFQDVKSAQAYMLFFVRRSSKHLQKTCSNSGQSTSNKLCNGKTPDGKNKLESATNGASVHNGSHLSTFRSEVNQISLADQRVTSNSCNSQHNPDSLGKLPSSNLNGGKHPMNGSAYDKKEFTVSYGNFNASNTGELVAESSRQSKDASGTRCVVPSSPAPASNFIPLICHGNGSSPSASSVQREKVVFKIGRPKDRCNGAGVSKSPASSTVSRVPSAPPRTDVASTPQNSSRKLVAYDDESSDQDSDILEDQKATIDRPAIEAHSSKSFDLSSKISDNSLPVESPCVPASDNVPWRDISLVGIKSENEKFETFSSSNDTQIPKRSLDFEMIEVKSEFSDSIKPPKLKRSLSDSKLQSRLSSEFRSPQSRNDCVPSVNGQFPHNSDNSVVKAEFCAKPLYNEHNEFVAVDITDSKRLNGFASDVDAAVQPGKPADCNNLDTVVPAPDTPLQIKTDPSENFAEIPPSDRFTSLAAKVTDDNHNTKTNSKKRKKSADDSTSHHKRHKHKPTEHDSDDDAYTWVERTLETIQQEKNVVLSGGQSKSADDFIHSRDGSNERNGLTMRHSDTTDTESNHKSQLHRSSSRTKTQDSARHRPNSTRQERLTGSVERSNKRHSSSRSRSSFRNRSSSRDRRRLESSRDKSKDATRYHKMLSRDGYEHGKHRHRDRH